MANQVNTLTNQDVMLDLYKIHAYHPNDAEGNPLTPFGNFSAGYEAASQHYEREIAELKAELEIAQGDNVLHRYRSAQLSQEITRLEGLVEQNKAFAENDKAFLDKITQLTAQYLSVMFRR